MYTHLYSRKSLVAVTIAPSLPVLQLLERAHHRLLLQLCHQANVCQQGDPAGLDKGLHCLGCVNAEERMRKIFHPLTRVTCRAGVVGNDPVALLSAALERAGRPCRVLALLNDTVGVLAAHRWVKAGESGPLLRARGPSKPPVPAPSSQIPGPQHRYRGDHRHGN